MCLLRIEQRRNPPLVFSLGTPSIITILRTSTYIYAPLCDIIQRYVSAYTSTYIYTRKIYYFAQDLLVIDIWHCSSIIDLLSIPSLTTIPIPWFSRLSELCMWAAFVENVRNIIRQIAPEWAWNFESISKKFLLRKILMFWQIKLALNIFSLIGMLLTWYPVERLCNRCTMIIILKIKKGHN